MYEFLVKFYDSHTEYWNRPFFVGGVSYAGHYVPAFAAHILSHKPAHINLRGVAVGGPFIDNQMQMGIDSLYLYENGIFSLWQYLYYSLTTLYACQTPMAIYPQGAYNICTLVNDEKDNAANLTNFMNIKANRTYWVESTAILRFFNDHEVQTRLGVCCMPYSTSNRTAGRTLREHDWVVSYQGDYATLLDQNIPVTVYYGDLDYTCHYRGGLAVAQHLPWTHRTQFQAAPWQDVNVNGHLYAVLKKHLHFEFYKIFDCGHLVPKDQPFFAYHLINTFMESHAAN